MLISRCLNYLRTGVEINVHGILKQHQVFLFSECAEYAEYALSALIMHIVHILHIVYITYIC
jgi:hypothetical protein